MPLASQLFANGTLFDPLRVVWNFKGVTITDDSANGWTLFDFTKEASGSFTGPVTVAPTAVATGSPVSLTITRAADTTLTASTESSTVKVDNTSTVQFATGALTTQRSFQITAPTYAFVGASTITNAATLAVTGAPIAGTNATLTNSYALWVQGGQSEFDGLVRISPAASTGTINSPLWVIAAADTALTASTESTTVIFDFSATRQWATGSLSNQRYLKIRQPTAAFVGASTITNAATVYVEGAPVAGTNATITNSYALWVAAGGVSLGDTAVTQLTSITTSVTSNTASGVITTVSASTAAQSTSTFTVNCTACAAGSVVVASLGAYSGTLGTNGTPIVTVSAVAAGSFNVRIYNAHAANALSGTLGINYAVL